MPFVSIRISGTATKDQKSGIVADVTASLVARLGKNPAAVQIVIEEVRTENYGAGGVLIVDRDAGKPPVQPVPGKLEEDAHAESSQ